MAWRGELLFLAVAGCATATAPPKPVASRPAPAVASVAAASAHAPAAAPLSRLDLNELGSAKLRGFASAPVFTPDGAEVCLLEKEMALRCFDATTLREIKKPGGRISRATRAMVVLDGARAFDAQTGAELKLPVPSDFPVVSFSADGSKMLATTYFEGRALLWDTRSGALLRKIQGPPTAEGGALTSSGDFIRWTYKEVGVELENVATHAKSRLGRAASDVSPDDRFTYMANAQNDDAELLDASGRVVAKLKGDAYDVTFSPSSRLYAVAHAKLLPCPDCVEGQPRLVGPSYALTLHTVDHEGTLATLATSGTIGFSRDDTKLAVVDGDTLRVYLIH